MIRKIGKNVLEVIFPAKSNTVRRHIIPVSSIKSFHIDRCNSAKICLSGTYDAGFRIAGNDLCWYPDISKDMTKAMEEFSTMNKVVEDAIVEYHTGI